MVQRHAVGASAHDLVELAHEHVLGPTEAAACQLDGAAAVVRRRRDVHHATLWFYGRM